MSVTSSVPHPHFLSIREFIIDNDPLCNLEVHPLYPPRASTHLHQVAVVNHPQAIMPSLSTANCQLLRHMTTQLTTTNC